MEPTLHTELLPAAARQMVTSNSQPRPALISYWANLLEETPEALNNWVKVEMTATAATGVPYLLIAGSELPAPLRESIVHAVPHAIVEVWAGSGHFPHLAHPDRFVDRLTATGQ
jgi:pimeloyl-ACP methyl ester carboxylesterase